MMILNVPSYQKSVQRDAPGNSDEGLVTPVPAEPVLDESMNDGEIVRDPLGPVVSEAVESQPIVRKQHVHKLKVEQSDEDVVDVEAKPVGAVPTKKASGLGLVAVVASVAFVGALFMRFTRG